MEPKCSNLPAALRQRGNKAGARSMADAPHNGEEKVLDEAPRSDGAKKEPEVNKLFRMVMKYQASDLHLKVGQPPMMRLRGDIRRTEMRPITQEDMERFF